MGFSQKQPAASVDHAAGRPQVVAQALLVVAGLIT